MAADPTSQNQTSPNTDAMSLGEYLRHLREHFLGRHCPQTEIPHRLPTDENPDFSITTDTLVLLESDCIPDPDPVDLLTLARLYNVPVEELTKRVTNCAGMAEKGRDFKRATKKAERTLAQLYHAGLVR